MNSTKEMPDVQSQDGLSNKSNTSLADPIKKEETSKMKTESDNEKSDDEKKPRDKDEKYKIEIPQEEELLGSVTTLSSPAVRTSARVIQKLKMDSIRPASPPPTEKKENNKEEKPVQKTPNQPKAHKVIWTNVERNLFFEALNEYGKDFDSICHYVNTKQKRKNTTDPFYKTKENVRQIYHQTFHKVSKYLRFSDDVKKHAQELYALINYGEMRKKLLFVNQKDCMKLKELVYKGSVTLRIKGKNVRIKTPSCKALRKLNQLEEWQEEIKLPTKVDVFLKPANLDSWTRVQNLAQNPRVRTILPLQKRVVSLLKTLQNRWRSRVARLCEQTLTLNTNPIPGTNAKNTTNDCDVKPNEFEPILCFAPPSDTIIHRPMVNLAEFLSSYSICLNSYEDRIGVSTKGETLCTERLNTLKEIFKTNSKRQRHDSGSEKRSPDFKRMKSEAEAALKSANVKSEEINKDVSDDSLNNSGKCESVYSSPTFNNIQIDGITQISVNEIENGLGGGDIGTTKSNFILHSNCSKTTSSGSDKDIDSAITETPPIATSSTAMISEHSAKITNENKTKRKESKCQNKKKETRKESFRTLLSDEVIQKIKKGWTTIDIGDLTIGDMYIMFGQDFKVNLTYSWVEQISREHTEANGNNKEDESGQQSNCVNQKNGTNELGNKLKQLLTLVNMSEKTKRKTNCSCDRGFRLKAKNEVYPTSYISSKIYPSSQSDSNVFRQPILPLRSGLSHVEAYRMNMNNARNKQSRWLKIRNSRPSKQVVVQRLLPVQPGVSQSYGLVTTHEEYLKNTICSPTSQPTDLSELIDMDPKSNLLSYRNSNNNTKIKSSTSSASANNLTSTSRSSINNSNTKSIVKNHNGNTSKEQEKSESKTNISIDKNTENGDHEMGTSTSSSDDTISEDSLIEDAGIKSLMEISLPSPVSDSNIDYIYNNGGLPMSPMGILRESPTDPKWFEDNVNDFSLSSFLGHLETACSGSESRKQNDSSNLSTIGDSSIDYMTKFVELAQSMKNQE